MNSSGSQTKHFLTPLPALIDFSLYSNLYVAAITAAVSFYYQSKFLPSVSFSYLAFLFCSTLFIYNLEHTQLKERDFINKPERTHWLLSNKRKVEILSALSFIIYFSLFLDGIHFKRTIAVLLMLLLSLLYCNNRFLKKIALFKNLLLAFIWSSATVIMPAMWNHNESMNSICSVAVSIYFLSALANSLLCDKADSLGDIYDGLHSLVSKFKKLHINTVLALINILIFVLSIKSQYYGFCLTALAYTYFAFSRKINHYAYDFCLLLPLIIMATE